MSEDVYIYECGLRIGNEYSSFMQSKNESEIDKHIEVMKLCCEEGDIVKYKKLYRCISTTPFVARGDL